MTKEKRVKRRRRSAVIYTPIAVLMIAVIAVFGISVFFRVGNIEVIGANKYTDEQILSMSGIKNGDNLVFIDKKDVAKKITSNLPYLNEVIIDKVVPDKIIIMVTESQPLAVITYDGSWWIIDQKARALEKADETVASEKIKIAGLTPAMAAEGQPISVEKADETKLEYLTGILSAIENVGLSSDVRELDISNIGNISFSYLNRFTVVLGGGENADLKITRLSKILAQLSPDDEGKIDLSNENEARFIPE